MPALAASPREAIAEVRSSLGPLCPTLNKTQIDLVHTLLLSLESHPIQVVEGAAGTGKTTAICLLVLVAHRMGLNVVVTAPTHKAVAVLREKIHALSPELELRFQTIHAMLKLKPQKSVPGQPETYKQSGLPALRNVDLVITDECSMIGDNEWTYLHEAVAQFGVPLVLSGDPHQLQPVGKKQRSQTFKAGTRYVLKDVVRHDGAILDLATNIRSYKFVHTIAPKVGESSVIEVFNDRDEWIAEWLRTLERAQGDTILLCWQNKHRLAFNQIAHRHIHEGRSELYAPGDAIITLAAYEKNGELVLANNQPMEIEAATFVPEYIPVGKLGHTFKTWVIETTDGDEFPVLDPSELDRINETVKGIAKSIKKQLKDAEKGASSVHASLIARASTEAKRRWATEFFPLRDAFASIDFPYAQTIHKSQGSTYREVFLYPDYIQSHFEKVNLQYVAVTRASRRLVALSPDASGVA
jgi:exodeoxyribonuclease V